MILVLGNCIIGYSFVKMLLINNVKELLISNKKICKLSISLELELSLFFTAQLILRVYIIKISHELYLTSITSFFEDY